MQTVNDALFYISPLFSSVVKSGIKPMRILLLLDPAPQFVCKLFRLLMVIRISYSRPVVSLGFWL
jgi:hypothetical protein